RLGGFLPDKSGLLVENRFIVERFQHFEPVGRVYFLIPTLRLSEERRRHTSKSGGQKNATGQRDNRERSSAAWHLPSRDAVLGIDVQQVERHGVHPFVYSEMVSVVSPPTHHELRVTSRRFARDPLAVNGGSIGLNERKGRQRVDPAKVDDE